MHCSCDERVYSRIGIKISFFREDSRNKDCKKVWKKPRALLRAHISWRFFVPFLFLSFSVVRSLTFLFLLSVLSAFLYSSDVARTPPWVVAAVYEYSRLPWQWDDERHPPPQLQLWRTTRAFCQRSTEKKSLTLGYLPAVPSCEPYHRFLKLLRESKAPSCLIYQNQAVAIGKRRNCPKMLSAVQRGIP